MKPSSRTEEMTRDGDGGFRCYYLGPDAIQPIPGCHPCELSAHAGLLGILGYPQIKGQKSLDIK